MELELPKVIREYIEVNEYEMQEVFRALGCKKVKVKEVGFSENSCSHVYVVYEGRQPKTLIKQVQKELEAEEQAAIAVQEEYAESWERAEYERLKEKFENSGS